MGLDMMTLDYGVVVKPLLFTEAECGDMIIIHELANYSLIVVIDVLGHGSVARSVAIKARTYIESHVTEELIDLMNGLHVYLKGSRGAVAAFCRIDYMNQSLDYVGIGNISVRIFGRNQIRMVPKDGVIGYMITQAYLKQTPFTSDDVLVMYTDGLKEHFQISESGGLLNKPSQDIADTLYEWFGKSSDDASCIVVKHK